MLREVFLPYSSRTVVFKCTNRGAIVVVQYSSVLGKIDEILVWEQRKETERDTTFVQLGRYLREVWAGQY